MERHELTPLIEALLFSADQPLTVAALLKVIDERSVTPVDVKQVLDALAETYDAAPRGFMLLRFGNAYQVVTRERFAPWVQTLVAGRRKARLTRAALETAAVVAYKQPITRLGIERIRGVDVGGVLGTLLERGLIMIKGRDPGPGRPLLYGTTQAFLEYFGLSRVSDLPRLDELVAMVKEREGSGWDETERTRMTRIGVAPDSVPSPETLEEGAKGEESGPGQVETRDPDPPPEPLDDESPREGEIAQP